MTTKAAAKSSTTLLDKKSMDKKSVKIAAPPQTQPGSVFTSPSPVAAAGDEANEPLTFSSVFWDAVLSVTGYRCDHLAVLRETNESERPSHDVVELVNRDLGWADAAVIHRLRSDLQEYIESLRALKAENEKQLRTRPFVEQKRYDAMRSRECSQRVTPQTIRESFASLNLSSKRVMLLDEEVTSFHELLELNVSRNQINALCFLPPKIQVLLASGNAIDYIDDLTIKLCNQLYVLGLACNRISDISFLQASPSLVAVDLSYNPLYSFDVANVIANHSTIRDVSFIGCPLTLFPRYRSRMLALCTNLRTLDGVAVTADASAAAPATATATIGTTPDKNGPMRSPRGKLNSTAPPAPLVNGQMSPSDASMNVVYDEDAMPTVYVQLVSIKGIQPLLPVEDTSRGIVSAKGKAAPASTKKVAGKVEEERPVPTVVPVVSLMGSWCTGCLPVALKDIELTAPPAVVDDPKNKNAKKPAAAPPASQHGGAIPPSDAAAAVVEPEVNLKTMIQTTLSSEVLSDLEAMRHQTFYMELEYAEYTTPGNVSPSASSTPARTTLCNYTLGTFVLSMYDILVSLVGTGGAPLPSKKEVTVALRPHQNTLANASVMLAEKNKALQEAIRDDAKLDALLAEIVAAETAVHEAPQVAAALASPAPAAAKGKSAAPAAASKQAVPKALSEATLAKQAESANRKVMIEEMTLAIKEDEKRLERIKGAKLSLVLQVALNTPIETEKVAETPAAPSPGAPGGAAKKK